MRESLVTSNTDRLIFSLQTPRLDQPMALDGDVSVFLPEADPAVVSGGLVQTA